MVGLVIAAHGHLAEELVATAEQIVGTLTLTATCSIEPGASPEVIREQMRRAVSAVEYASLLEDKSRTMLLIRDVAAVLAAREKGLRLTHLNLGNIHYAPGRRKVSASVFLSKDELAQLKILAEQGVEIEARGVPTDAPVNLPEMTDRFAKGA